MLKFIFWISLFILIYTYFFYPLLLWLFNRFFYRPVAKRMIEPKISFLVAVYNEEENIERKINNILALDYPGDKLEIAIGSDGSTDATDKIIKKYEQIGVKLFAFSRRQGKINVINAIVPKLKGDILVFSDVRQVFQKNALRELAANFADPRVGCVSGELILNGQEENAVAKGVGVYWKYEKFMRMLESNIFSMIGATGAIYAVRRELYCPPPKDTILDDVFIPLKVVEQGYRSVFDPAAKAFDQVSNYSKDEFRRKARTHAGNFQVFFQCRNLLIPFKSKICWQFFSHKLLRVIAFLFIGSLFLSSLLLVFEYPYRLALGLQLVFYSLAFSGWMIEKFQLGHKISSIPYMFCVLNLAAVNGFWRFILRRQNVTW